MPPRPRPTPTKPRLFIGLMSGTSVDSIDAALVRITGHAPHYHLRVLHHLDHPWPKKIRARLLAIMAPAQTTTAELCELNFLVAHEFANAVTKILAATKTKSAAITALASHGQTICHLPPPPPSPSKKSKIENSGGRKSKIPSTLQLGDPSVLATLTGIPTVGNFRPADMAAGGQSAPLVPWTDKILLSHPTLTRCIQNIGGIANVTFLASHQLSAATDHDVLAFDTGPGNMLIDAAVAIATDGKKRFDHNGRLAAQGSLDMPLFRSLQAHPYFDRHPPKSTGREDFGLPFAQKLLTKSENRKLKIENLLHTLTRLTAWSIADAYVQFLPRLPDELILCGGGADNPVLVRMLTEEFSRFSSHYNNGSLPIASPTHNRIDDFGIPNKAKEAASFALLGAATLDHVPANLPAVTGATRPVMLGVIAHP